MTSNKPYEWRPHRVTAHFKDDHPDIETCDVLDNMLTELFKIENPSLRPRDEHFTEELKKYKKTYLNHDSGSWFYYPWKNALVHVLSERDYRVVRTARNHDLITKEEQAKVAKASIGIAGLSVGSSTLEALTLAGHYKTIRIADFDELELSNLNRISGSVCDISKPKWVESARKVTELDPYAEVEIFPKGLTEGNIGDFVRGLSVAVDAIDSLAMKARLRLKAQEHKVAVVMATDVENIILDVERFDQDPGPSPFNGMLTQDELKMVMDQGGLDLALALRIIGPENLHLPMLNSIPRIGKTLASHPQMGPTARAAGGIAAHAVLRIILDQPVASGRTVFGVMSKLDPTYFSPDSVQEREDFLIALEQTLAQGARP
jgi:ThiF family